MSIKFTNNRNPILPVQYHIPDAEAHVMPDGKLYVYGSFDESSEVFCSEKYYVLSTENMEDWELHDESLNGKNVPWFNNPEYPKYPGIDWSKPTPFIRKMMEDQDFEVDMEKFQKEDKEKPALLFAPDAIHKNGKYYLYFCMSDESEGVAVSDKPEGPFENIVQLPCGGIDPAIFIDDDGKSYYYWGQLYSHGVELNDDMISFDENKIVHDLVTEEGHFFHEGSSMRKIGDNYYYLYANMERGKPTSLGYSMSKSPLGPFEYKGIIIDNDGCDPASWNNHGSIEEVNGEWYVFYHRCSRGVKEYRRLCIEPIEIIEDGTIPEVKMTSQGIGEPFINGEMIFGYQACGLKGKIFIGIDENGEELLTNIKHNDEAVFRYIRSKTGFNAISFNCRGEGYVEVLFNEKTVAKGLIKNGLTKIILEKTVLCNKETELKIIFENPKDLKLMSITII